MDLAQPIKNNMIKRLIFDIDGTLIRNVNFKEAITSTLKDFELYSLENVQNFLLAISSYEANYKSYRKEDYLSFFGEYLHAKLDDNFLKCFFRYLKEVVPENSKDIKDTVAYLSQKYELVLLSNYFEESQRNRLETMGINTYFTEYYGEKIIKPYKEAYLSACGTCKPSECVMIGDNIELDIKVPKELGLYTILISNEPNKIADKTITNIKELKNIL